jgi:hypothetical protein
MLILPVKTFTISHPAFLQHKSFPTYMMLQPVHNQTDRVQQCHLGLWELDFLHQRHQPIEHDRRIREEVIGLELPLIDNGVELSSCGDANNLVVQRIATVKQMLEDLVNNGLLLFGNLNGNPLCDDDGDTATDDVEARLLLASLSNQSVLEEGIEIELIVQYVCCETNGGVN